MNVVDRISTLTEESTTLAFDTAAFVQQQNVQFAKAWLDATVAGQNAMKDLTLRAIRQTQQAQSLWLDVAQETVRTGVDTATAVGKTQLHETSEQLDKVNSRVKAAANSEKSSK
jgi:hypothetical protein